MNINTSKKNIVIFSYSILIIFFIVDFNLLKNHKFQGKLTWDGVDYAHSAEKGIYENIFELESLSFVKFLQIGFIKLNSENKKKVEFNKLKFNDQKEDVFHLRHFHPPLSSIYWSFFTDENKLSQDDKLKKSLKFLSYFIFLVLFFFIAKNNFNNFNINILFLVIFFYSDLVNTIYGNLNYHLFFSLCFLLYLISFLRLINNFNLLNSLIFSLCLFLLFFSLETAIFVLIGSPISFFLFKKHIKIKYKYVFIIIFFTSCLLIILWPANLYNFSIAKTYLMYAFRIFVDSNVEYSDISYLLFYKSLFRNNLILFFSILIFILFALYNFKYSINNKKFVFIFLHSLIYFLIIFPFTVHQNYIFPSILILFLGILYYFNGISIKNRIIKILSIPISILILLTHNSYSADNDYKLNKDNIDLTIDVINLYNDNSEILIDGGHIFRYYSDYSYIIDLYLFDAFNPQFYVRENYTNVRVNKKIEDKYYSIIIIQKNRNYSKEQLTFITNSGYFIIKNTEYHIFVRKNFENEN